MVTKTPQQLIYFVSGMWCSTCAKNIREAVSQIDGVTSADVNYVSKLLLVQTESTDKTPFNEATPLDLVIQSKVSQIGFGIKKQSAGWVLNFYENLKKESVSKIPWTQVSLVWFLAMWSSMLAFAGYIGEELSPKELYTLALASSIFGLPAIILGIIPYANSGLRALWFSKFLTLDFFIFLGGGAAIGVSCLSLLSDSPVTYADSGSMIIAILLLTKKIENSIMGTITSNILFQLHPKNKTIEVLKKDGWAFADISQIKRGDRVRIHTQETIPFDGVLENASAEINNHLISGETGSVPLKMGDSVFAGAIAQNEFELSITHPQGERMIDSWAEAALLSDSSKSEHTKLFSRIENALVIFAFCGALLIASIQTFKGAGTRTIIESFFIGILIFCPCLFASIIPLMKQMAHLALLKSGIMLSRSDALLDLSQVTNFYFDKTGTLEAMESTFIPLEESGKTVIPYLHALAIKSKHVILRGLNGTENSAVISEIREHPGKGAEAVATDGTKILVGRSSFLKEMGIESCGLDPIFSHIAMNGKVVGQVLSKRIYDSKSKYFLKKLLLSVPDVKIEILSGDPGPDAGKYFTNIDQKISFRGNLSPEEKAQAIRGYSAFIGDGLNDTLALAKARVSFRIGHRIIGFAPVDFHLQLPNIDLILATIHYSKKYRKVLIQTGCAAFLYNILALTLASLGKFSPLGAVLAMLTSFSLMLLSAFRLNKLQSRTQGMTQ